LPTSPEEGRERGGAKNDRWVLAWTLGWTHGQFARIWLLKEEWVGLELRNSGFLLMHVNCGIPM